MTCPIFTLTAILNYLLVPTTQACLQWLATLSARAYFKSTVPEL